MNKYSKQFNLDHTIFAWSNQKGLDPIHVKKANGVYLYDEKGIVWPKSLAPFEVAIVEVNQKSKEKIKGKC